jgi:hypothetical protein
MGRDHEALLQHGCTVFTDVDAFAAFGRDFCAEGEELGEKAMYLDRDETVAAYGDGSLAPEEQIEIWRTTLREALAEGFTGLRVVADLTGIVPEDPVGIAALAHYEHLVDRFMETTPHIHGRCGFDSTAIDPTVLSALTALHAPSGFNPSSVHLTAMGAGDDVRLAGELDHLVMVGSLPIMFQAVLPEPGSAQRTLRVDAAELSYVDHRSLKELDGLLDQTGFSLEITTNRRLLHRLVDFAALRNIACVDAS